MSDPYNSLVPAPRSCRVQAGVHRLQLTRPLGVLLEGTRDPRPLRRIERALHEQGLEVAQRDAPATLRLVCSSEMAGSSSAVQPEAYHIEVGPEQVLLTAVDPRGLFYAAVTFGQMLRASPREGDTLLMACASVRDEPAFPRRGLMLDISRDRVPTNDRLDALLDLCAELKLNHLELYTEHTFAYEGHEVVWRDASPILPTELDRLRERARENHVELVPNQQTFGHMHRWLTHADYRHLAEVPGGVRHAFSFDAQPFSLCPTDPGSLQLIQDLLEQLLPHFSSELVNIGCDETFDLGQGRSADACARRGRGRVYLDHLHAVHDLLERHGRRTCFWGDVILQHPELVPELPPNSIALLWGYEAGHPFQEQAERFARSELEFWVCPGTSSWQSMLGRVDNMRANTREAARAGLDQGAGGLLLTDWGDFGHWQAPSVAWPGYLSGAHHAWSGDTPPADLALAIDLHVLHRPGCGVGRALLDLGVLYKECAAACPNGAPWFFLIRRAYQGVPPRPIEGLSLQGLHNVRERGAEVLARLRASAGSSVELSASVQTLEAAMDLTRWACQLGEARLEHGDGSALDALDARQRGVLVEDLAGVLQGMRAAWILDSRPGGLEHSLQPLVRLSRWIDCGGRGWL